MKEQEIRRPGMNFKSGDILSIPPVKLLLFSVLEKRENINLAWEEYYADTFYYDNTSHKIAWVRARMLSLFQDLYCKLLKTHSTEELNKMRETMQEGNISELEALTLELEVWMAKNGMTSVLPDKEDVYYE